MPACRFMVVLAVGWTARSLIMAEAWTAGVRPEERARFVGENISGLMNVVVLGLPAGLVAGMLLVLRRRARARVR